MKIFLEVLKFIFCPILFFYDHNANERIVNTKYRYLIYIAIIFTAIIIVGLVYLEEIIDLVK